MAWKRTEPTRGWTLSHWFTVSCWPARLSNRKTRNSSCPRRTHCSVSRTPPTRSTISTLLCRSPTQTYALLFSRHILCEGVHCKCNTGVRETIAFTVHCSRSFSLWPRAAAALQDAERGIPEHAAGCALRARATGDCDSWDVRLYLARSFWREGRSIAVLSIIVGTLLINVMLIALLQWREMVRRFLPIYTRTSKMRLSPYTIICL